MARVSDTIIAGNCFLIGADRFRIFECGVLFPTSIPAERYSMKVYGRSRDIVTNWLIGITQHSFLRR
jgi:hypothetical protein